MNLKKTKITLAASLLTATFLLSIASSAEAQNSGYPSYDRSIFNQLQKSNSDMLSELRQNNSYWANLPNLLQTAIGNALNQVSSWMFETVPGIGKTIASTSSVKAILPYENQTAENTSTQLSNTFQYINPEGGTQKWQGWHRITIPYKFEGEGPQLDNIGKYINPTITVSGDDNKFTTASSLLANNFLNPVKYNSTELQAARNYIGYASGATIQLTPTENINFDSNNSLAQRLYKNQYDTLAAIQSLSAYNLSKLYAERVGVPTDTIKDLGKTDKKTISSEELFQSLAMEKATNPEWYKTMATVSPFTSIRELLNFSAGGFMELYRMEKTQEQILATLSELNTLMVMQQSRELAKENPSEGQ